MGAQGSTYPGRIPVFGKSPVPGFFIPAHPDPAVDKAAFFGFDAPGDNIPHYEARSQDSKALAGDYIAENHPSHGNRGTAYIAFHPGPFPNDYPALGLDIPLNIAIYPGKSAGFNIPGYAGARTYDGIDGEVFVPNRGHARSSTW